SLRRVDDPAAPRDERQQVEITVQDQGIGIPADELERVFDRFYRSPNAAGVEGMGLGLYVARGLIALHHGRIWAHSPGPGLGTTVYIRLPLRRAVSSRRSSSWDRTGGNRDRCELQPGERAILLEAAGAGCVRHLWITVGRDEPGLLRRCTLRAWWDGEATPSVEVPLGDFFGVGFAATRELVSLPIQRGPDSGRGLACYFPMPFSNGARMELQAETESGPTLVYFHVDYEVYPALGPHW